MGVPRAVDVLGEGIREDGGMERVERVRSEGLRCDEGAVGARMPKSAGKAPRVMEVQILTDEEDVEEVKTRRGRRVKPLMVVRGEVSGDEGEGRSCVEDGGDGMSDFIVSDGSSVEEDEDEEEEDDRPAPRSVRKLVRGRRPDEAERTVGRRVQQNRDLLIDWSDHDTTEESAQVPSLLTRRLFPSEKPRDTTSRFQKESLIAWSDDTKEKNTAAPPPVARCLFPTEQTQDTSSDFEEESPILSFDPAVDRASRKPSKETRCITPPSSPKKSQKGLVSPKKLPRIPATPHRQSMDDFWKPEVVNEWNDEFSPRKQLKPINFRPDSLNTDTTTASPKKSPVKRDKALVEAKKRFNEDKHAIAEAFLRELDEVITDGKISSLSASTGGVKIIWSKKLNTTAGRANWRREGIRTHAHASTAATVTYRHHASIELAEKVIDDADRLLNVVAHEFCHLANFMVSGVLNNPHGKEFKGWAARCSAAFGERGIEVTTKHSYAIAFKYVWACSSAGCGVEFKRHSRSIDPKRHTCGVCKGRLVQTKPVPRGGEGREGKGMGEYQAFVKEHMGRVREENPGSPQKEIMTLVGRRYQESKATRLREVGKSGLGLDGVAEEEEALERDPVDVIVRKIDFLNLTSP